MINYMLHDARPSPFLDCGFGEIDDLRVAAGETQLNRKSVGLNLSMLRTCLRAALITAALDLPAITKSRWKPSGSIGGSRLRISL